MSEQTPEPYYEDVIDLRELVQTLWDAKWIIIGITLAAALAAFLVSSYLIPPQYQAEALVTLLEPNLQVELETSIQSGEVRLNSSGLPELAESAAVREQVFAELGIGDQAQRSSYEFAASLVGEGQLRLRVTAPEPEQALEAANTWAAAVVETLNELYGEGESSEKVLAAEVQRAREQWQSAQEDLEAYFPENQVESLRVELAAAKSRLALYQAKGDQNQLLQIDLGGLRGQLEEAPAGSLISTSRYLALIALQQRAVSVSNAAYLQDVGGDVSGQSGDTLLEIPEIGLVTIRAEEAREELASLGAALKAAEGEVWLLVDQAGGEVNQLRASLEMEEYRIAELTEERNLARRAYTALRSQLEENRISQAQQGSVVRIGAGAVEPNQPSGPRTLLNTALAGLIGGMLAVGGVLAVDWWSADKSKI